MVDRKADQQVRPEARQHKTSAEVQILEDLKRRIQCEVDESLHCEVEVITGHSSSAVLSVFPTKEKKFDDRLSSFQPVRYIFTPSGQYKFQVFIHKTVEEGDIDIQSSSELRSCLQKLRKSSGYVLCPGIQDYLDISCDLRVKSTKIKEQTWPWKHVAARQCKLWHKPRASYTEDDQSEKEAEVCSECKLARRQLKVVQERRKELDESARTKRQDASSKVIFYLA